MLSQYTTSPPQQLPNAVLNTRVGGVERRHYTLVLPSMMVLGMATTQKLVTSFHLLMVGKVHGMTQVKQVPLRTLRKICKSKETHQ
jgi:hypothetical protein